MNFLLILLFLPLVTEASTRVTFVDWCSEKEIHVSTPNGTRLLLQIDELDPEDSLEVAVEFRPAGVLEDLSPEDKTTYKLKYKAGNTSLRSLINLPKYRWMGQVEQRNAEYRIWDAEVTWIQEKSRKAGSAFTTFYRAPGNGPYFQLLSEGLCQWEEESAISSRLYENNSTTWMNVSRDTTQIWHHGPARGLSIGYDNNARGNLPLGTNPGNAAYGWLFKDWQKQHSKDRTLGLEKKYVLNRDEAGLFISRLSFNRHHVKKYEWKKEKGSCGEFVATSHGYLDAGVVSEDFIVIPKTFYPRPEKLQEYIRTIRPPVNNCDHSVGSGAQYASDILPSGMDGILFYYKLKNIRGEI